MASRYFIRRNARDDLNAIWSYVVLYNHASADRLIDRITDSFRMIADFPAAGRARADINPILRSFSVDDYVVFYTVTADRLEIVRVLHGRQDFDASDFDAD